MLTDLQEVQDILLFCTNIVHPEKKSFNDPVLTRQTTWNDTCQHCLLFVHT